MSTNRYKRNDKINKKYSKNLYVPFIDLTNDVPNSPYPETYNESNNEHIC